MVNTSAAQPLRPTYGPVTFLAALANILLVETSVWVVVPWLPLALYVLPLVVINLAVALVLRSRSGTPGQVGRGMLIGLLAVPLALAVFLPGFWLAQAFNVV